MSINELRNLSVKIELIDVSLEFVLVFFECIEDTEFDILIDFWGFLFDLKYFGLICKFFFKELIYLI